MCDPRNALLGAFECVFEDAREDSLQDLCEAMAQYRRRNPKLVERSHLLQDFIEAAVSELAYRKSPRNPEGVHLL